MTLQQIIRDVYEALGEPSDLEYKDDLDVIDTASDGWHKLVDYVNNACLGIATWKFPDRRTIRFRFLEDVAYLSTIFETATVVASVVSMPIIETTLTNLTIDAYAGCAIRVGSNVYRVRYSRPDPINPTHVDLMLEGQITVTAGTSLSLSKRDYRFVNQVLDPFATIPVGIAYTASNGAPLEITNIYDMTTNSELDLLKKYDPLIAVQVSFQTPSQYYKLAQGIRFDSYPSSSLSYSVRYMRGPRVLSYISIDAEPELPVQFHEAIILHALWWGYRRMQENNSAYSTKQDLTDMLSRVRTEYDLQGELTSHQFTIA